MVDVRPIRTEADYDWALVEIERYFENEPEPGTPEADRFDVLAALIESYEGKHWAIEPADPIDAIEYALETRGLKQADLGRILGSAPRASEVMHRKRSLTVEMAYRINKELGVPAETLIRPYHLAKESDPVLTVKKAGKLVARKVSSVSSKSVSPEGAPPKGRKRRFQSVAPVPRTRARARVTGG